MATRMSAANATRRNTVPAGPASSKICLASDAPSCVVATPPRTNRGAGTASIVRRSLTAGKLPTVRRVPVVRTALATALALLAMAGSAWARPNVVLVMTDDQTQESIKVMPRTLGLLGTYGTTFDNSVVTFPLCCPSRATYLSGQYAHNHGVINNVPPFGGFSRFDQANALGTWLQRAGYRTIHVGRTLNGYGTDTPDISLVPPGWNDWIVPVEPTVYEYERWRMNENGQILELPDLTHPGEFQTDYLTRRATELIGSTAPSGQPFFLSLTYPAPHVGRPSTAAPRHRGLLATAPLPADPSFNEADVRDKPRIIRRRSRMDPFAAGVVATAYRQQLESLLSVDEGVAQVIEALRRTGTLDNTLVIFTSDNGLVNGQHRVRQAKIFPYEPSIRVPLLMRGPGVPVGRHVFQQAANIDLAPTILDAADAQPGRLLDGRSLLPMAADPANRSGRELVIENGRGLRTQSQYRGLRNERYVYIRHDRTGERELYDLRLDPFQLRNLAREKRHRRVRILMHRRLRKLQRCRGQRSCEASRPKIRVRRCDGRLRAGGGEAHRVRRLTDLGTRVRVTMVDGRVATYTPSTCPQ